ncbi:hypothetical protein F6V30_06410 [Oryzomonas sagensis]|uniref:RiboL-PSP-HEPN domain-containing protein n=1 Tax=Oryzomonas sagensis TaxID=2603857 RepID=A0ABQ6TT56_9BACT|nr:hypothetical protein [Oryzomonas sagensis]KAB0672193.1 hypothetical protein F6V30_06410 [Oryzomonas sagensis]
MSYCSENILPADTKIRNLQDLVELLGYKKIKIAYKIPGEIAHYYWFEEEEYRSYTGIELSIYRTEQGEVSVQTRSRIARSYWDLAHQNETIRRIRSYFGGIFSTDAGANRYEHVEGTPPTQAQSGCHRAFQRFGSNIIKAMRYIDERSFTSDRIKYNELEFLQAYSPRVLSNNLLLPFMTSVLEDYFKSTFISILKSSEKKETFFKGNRFSSEHLTLISDRQLSVEDATAESLSFQNINSICQHFKSLEPKLDLAGVLRKPYRRRKESLFDSLERMVKRRHLIIHQATIDITLKDIDAARMIDDLQESVVRCYKRITDFYMWEFDQGWGCSSAVSRVRKTSSSMDENLVENLRGGEGQALEN